MRSYLLFFFIRRRKKIPILLRTKFLHPHKGLSLWVYSHISVLMNVTQVVCWRLFYLPRYQQETPCGYKQVLLTYPFRELNRDIIISSGHIITHIPIPEIGMWLVFSVRFLFLSNVFVVPNRYQCNVWFIIVFPDLAWFL